MPNLPIPNSLNIAEPDLLGSHNQIIQCFIQNNIPFEAEYNQEFNPEFSSTVFYTIQTNDKRYGFISATKKGFAGAIVKGERIRYLQKEGFDMESALDSEPVFAKAPCVMAFVSMLAIDLLGKLKFDDDLIEEFDRVTSKN